MHTCRAAPAPQKQRRVSHLLPVHQPDRPHHHHPDLDVGLGRIELMAGGELKEEVAEHDDVDAVPSTSQGSMGEPPAAVSAKAQKGPRQREKRAKGAAPA